MVHWGFFDPDSKCQENLKCGCLHIHFWITTHFPELTLMCLNLTFGLESSAIWEQSGINCLATKIKSKTKNVTRVTM